MSTTKPIPIFLITGTLGAGKTTFLNHLLSHEAFRNKRICLIINEFGELGVDGQLVDSGDLPKFELNKGSLFCICIKTDFIKTLQEIADEVKPEMLVVEATGMSEPRDIQDFIDVPELAERFCIHANLCIVDTPNFIRLAPMLRSARQQAIWADGMVLNKTDLVSDLELKQVTDVLTDYNDVAPKEQVTHGEVSDEFLAGLSHTIRRGDQLTEPPDPVLALSFTRDEPVDEAQFRKAVADMGEKLLRLKGQIDFGKGPVFVEYAGARLTMGEKPPLKSEGTAFVAIGWRLRTDDFKAGMEAAWDQEKE